MTLPNMTPPSSPWSVVIPEVPGQRPPESRHPVGTPYGQQYSPAQQVPPASDQDVEAPTEVIQRDPSSAEATTSQMDTIKKQNTTDTSEPAAKATPEPAPSSNRGTASLEKSAAKKEAPSRPTPKPKASGDILISAADAAQFRERFAKALPLFIDDPAGAVAQASEVVTAAVDELAAALHNQHGTIHPKDSAAKADTETLRMALRAYRELLDRILTLS